MKNNKMKPIVLLITSLVVSSVYAEEAVLPTVNVQADSPYPDLDPASLQNPYKVESSARVGTQIFNREDIEALAPRDVIDLLDRATGMNVTYQGRKSPYFPEARGGGTLTYILDGAILPSAANRILQKIPLAAIEQIEVVRGSTSLAIGPSIPIGSSASGSGINTGYVIIRTRRPKGTEAEVSGYVEKAVSQPTANGESVYTGTQFSSKESPVKGYIGGMVSRSERPSKDEWFDGQKANAQMAVGGFQVGGFSFGTTAYQDMGRFEMQRGVTVTGSLDSSKWYYDPIKTKLLAANMGMEWNKNQVTLLSVFSTEYEQTEYNESFANSTITTRRFNEKSSGYNLRHNARFDETLVQLSAQSTRSEGYGPNLSNTYNNWQTSVNGYSASVEQNLFKRQLSLDAGYRYDQKHIDRSATSAAKLAANNDVDMAPAKVMTLGTRWKFTENYALSARYFEGDEGTSGDFDIVLSSGTAHPTKQKRREVSFEAKPASYFQPTLTWFDVDIENQKTATNNTYTVNGDTYYYYTEVDTRRRGLELLLKGNITPRTKYSASYTHMLAIETSGSDAIGTTEPMHLYTAMVSHGWDSYRANVSVKRVSGWDTSTSAMGTAYDVHLGDYTRVDANLLRDFQISSYKATAELYVRNLGNEHYATRYTTGYYYDRGRTLGVLLTVKL
jgi:iron complex outermembrane recepter protein